MAKKQPIPLDELDKKMDPKILKQAIENAKLAEILEKSQKDSWDVMRDLKNKHRTS
ncbi:hypothetical protein [Marinibactrum halimedae]|uniref:Uncharacterized protein n=1 Tax=Marinibactrum halimedae TaxID=1444977 RepID=A0AA37T3R0_9GAMM|nr:hypothetical protein [Marinibactrum halimedae]MCD9461040.1 hypothetical protein [Marinibactrum halimedae]GLS24418.1 hypothetical protein GCM10007877_01290 [Marinibactrum halimedae]